MTKRNGKHPPNKNGKQADNRRKDASPLNGVVPPPEHRYQPGAPSPNPHGRPRKLKELQDLIKDVMAEELNVGSDRITRITAAIRLGLSKNPAIWLEYAYGKMPQPTHELNADEWRTYLKDNGYTDAEIDSLVNEFATHMGHRRVGAGSGEAGENESGQ